MTTAGVVGVVGGDHGPGPVGASVVAAVVGGGSIAWDDPIVKYLPGFALKDPYVTKKITIADMYSHRSGLPKATGYLLEDIGYDRAQVLDRLRQLPLGPFRAQYACANFGLTTGAEAVAASQHQEWSQLSKQQIVAPEALQQSRIPYATSSPAKTADARSSSYGLGIGVGVDDVGRVRFSHSGAFVLGASTVINLLPSEKLGIAVLTNGAPRVYLRPSRQANPVTSAPLASYVGTYANSYYGPARVRMVDGKLVFAVGPKDMKFGAYPLGRRHFLHDANR